MSQHMNQHTPYEKAKIELGYNDQQMALRALAKSVGFPGNVPVMPGHPARGLGIYFLCLTYAKTELAPIREAADRLEQALVDHPTFVHLETVDHGSTRSQNHSAFTVKVQLREYYEDGQEDNTDAG